MKNLVIVGVQHVAISIRALWVVIALGLFMVISSPLAFSASKLVTFDTVEQEELYEDLLEEYRCLKCQNQNLADSNAELAGDLRNEIRDQVVAGRSRTDIDDYLIARYGDFVLYKPQLKPSTYILWFGPFVLLFIAAWYAIKIVNGHRKLNAAEATEIDPTNVDKAKSLLDD